MRWLRPEENTAGLAEGDEDALGQFDEEKTIDARTRVIAIGLASNATGRVHEEAIRKVGRRVEALKRAASSEGAARHPLFVLDGTHYVPHRAMSLDDAFPGADAVVCSAYKFGGPHLGLLAFSRSSVLAQDGFAVAKVGRRSAREDILPAGCPTLESYEISRWELGTLPYESLAGLVAMVEKYYKNSACFPQPLRRAFDAVRLHEQTLSEAFLQEFARLPPGGRRQLALHGSRDARERTPTFAVSAEDVAGLCEVLNKRGIFCTYGNHYAPELVDRHLNKDGVVRLSFLHYNTVEDVDAVVAALADYAREHP